MTEQTNIGSLNINVNRHIFVSGQTQTGKSYFIKKLFDSLPAGNPAIFFDYKHDPNHAEFIKKYKVFTSLKDIKRFYLGNKVFHKKQDQRIIYRPPRVSTAVEKTHSMDNPRWKQLNELCDYIFKKGNFLLVIDDVASFTSSFKLPPHLYDCIIMGASRNVVIISLSQRPNVVHNSLIAESYTYVLFRHELDSDRKKLRGFIGNDADSFGNMPNRQFYFKTVGQPGYYGELVDDM